VSIHKEISFEGEICQQLSAHGWLYDPTDAARYDRSRALYPPDVVAWVQETQPKAWDALQKTHGASAENVLLDRIRQQLNQIGTLDVLRWPVSRASFNICISLATRGICCRQPCRRRKHVYRTGQEGTC
jgi:type I restriction enzyme R subunit